MDLFGTSGIRGDAQKFFTNQFSFDLGRTFVKFLNQHQQVGPVAVGMDPRGSSPRISEALQQGIGHEKRAILDQGGCPIPAINYLLKVSSAIGGVGITGSHITADLNGIKFFAFDEEILKNHEKEIEKIYYRLKNKVAFKKRKISVREDNSARMEYEEMLVKLGGKLPNWKVVVDPGNGAQSELMSKVLERIGLKVMAINDHLQGDFMSRDTEKKGDFDQLQKRVVKEKAFLGIGFDADGDRVIFIDEKGNFVPGDYSCSLIAKHGDSDTIVTPINTSQVVEYLGKKVIRTKVGSPYVVAAMKKHQASFGFEGNGGGISAEIMMSRDGGSTSIKLLKLLHQSKKSLSDLVATLPKFFIVKDKTDCPRKFNSIILKKFREKYRSKKTEEIDGIKVWLEPTAWVLYRPSSNAPEFRVFAETRAEKKSSQIVQVGLEFIKEQIKDN